MNIVCLTGRFTKDPEVKKTESGVSVVSFTLAVDRDYAKNGQRETDFINCVAWRNTAEFIGNYFSKGKEVAVVGSMQTRSYDDQNGNKRNITEVVISNVNFIGSRNDSDNDRKDEANLAGMQNEIMQTDAPHLPFDLI